jgi:DNA-directed RNA polymerase subunit RPC12/RpoP
MLAYNKSLKYCFSLCKSKIKLGVLPVEDDYNPMKVRCRKCHRVLYIARVEVVLSEELGVIRNAYSNDS